jgi:hypothetical protein
MARSTELQLSADELKKMKFDPNFIIEFLSLTANQFGPAGSVIIPAAATSITVSANVDAETRIIATVAGDDMTLKSVAIVATAYSFDVIPNAAPTADTRVDYLIL